MKTKISIIALLAIVLMSCGGNGGNQSNTVNVTQQQKPAMLVIPSDQLLQQFGKLKQQEALGKTLQVRDYNGYLLTDQDSKFIISTIQSAFIQMGYPLNDLEQTLKSINEQEMLDAIDGIQKDAKTILLTTAKPDIILELDYNIVTDRSSRDFKKSLTYTLRAKWPVSLDRKKEVPL